jgi:hypothetical protein
MHNGVVSAESLAANFARNAAHHRHTAFAIRKLRAIPPIHRRELPRGRVRDRNAPQVNVVRWLGFAIDIEEVAVAHHGCAQHDLGRLDVHIAHLPRRWFRVRIFDQKNAAPDALKSKRILVRIPRDAALRQ